MKAILLGTTHSIQRGKNCPEQFRNLLEIEYRSRKIQAIAEEIDKDSVYVAETFCIENQLKILVFGT